MTARRLRSHPARTAILKTMRWYERPIGVAGLSRFTGATPSSTAYHVRVLAAAGEIEPAGVARGRRGSAEHLYTLVEDPTTWPEWLLKLCGALTVRHADGGAFPVATELDHAARAQLRTLLDGLRPQVQQIAAASTARVRARRG